MSDKPSKPADSLEPEARPLYNGTPDRAIQLSQAISMKRMADDLPPAIAALSEEIRRVLNGEVSE